MTAIDYFTRKGLVKIIKSESTLEIVKFIEEVNNLIPIKELISDGQEKIHKTR